MKLLTILFAISLTPFLWANEEPERAPIIVKAKSCLGEFRCVPKCKTRYSNGHCSTFSQDFCGFQASCAKYCVSRYSNGRCRKYGPDICGSIHD